MKKYIKLLYILLFGVVLTRVVTMISLPLTDTTEARYANTALMMSNLNDWITPFFRYGEPFLGKPPFAFWFEALSYRIFGVADFVPRLPSLLITIATVWLIYKLLITLNDKLTATIASIIYMSSYSVFLVSGAVMTDAFLVFGTTLSLVSFLLVVNGYRDYWRYLLFVGIGIGILTKGPLAVVVIGGIIGLWIVLSFRERITILRLFPWVSGTLLMIAIFLPWYIAQEIKNPGFLYYFIVGENLGRFLDTGWHGDKYGYVHKEPRGMIWLFWLLASFPWSLVAISMVVKLRKQITKQQMSYWIKDDNISFYIVWALFIMLFFTLGGNVLWYYPLPSIGGFVILMSLLFTKDGVESLFSKYKLIIMSSLLIPIISIALLATITLKPDSIRTEKYLIERYRDIAKSNEKIYFVGKSSFSAVYYMNLGKNLEDITPKEYQELIKDSKKRHFVVAKKSVLNKLNVKNLKKVYESNRYILLESY